LTSTPPALAVDRAASALLVYTDSDQVTVWKPVATASKDLVQFTTRARWSTDFITAASVDLVTAASPKGYDEKRHEAELGVAWIGDSGSILDLSATISREPDFQSQGAQLSASLPLQSGRFVTAAGIGYGTASQTRKGKGETWRDRDTADLWLSGTAVIAPRIAVDLVGTLQRQDGALYSPYRFVRLYRGDATLHETAVAESVPGERWRPAATLRVRWKAGADLFALGEYRFYRDSWAVTGHTGRARDVDPARTRVDGRRRGAGNVAIRRIVLRGPYTLASDIPRWRTADKELGPMRTQLAGLRVEWSGKVLQRHAVRLGAGADVLRMVCLDHPYLPERTELLTIMDLAWEL
jgi:hypothetical protein